MQATTLRGTIACPSVARLEKHAPVSPRCSSAQQHSAATSRRQTLELAATLALTPLLSPAAAFAEKGPKGFVPVRDPQDGYSFLYPFGWQEVQIDGQDVVYKDVIEPLESVSVGMIPTDKKDVGEFGPINDVCMTLATKVLTSPKQTVDLVKAEERVIDGRKYYDFEFTAKASNYTRHAVASVTVGNGKFYTIVSGSNERRWGKMNNKLGTVIKSFTVAEVF